ncbi:hypothetical protein [Candidatus Tisiphia endosymbiont of Beris chalybata]|uniref:hypothetical protein n=1 Tax=Candidatus Tisiphia endosymbiont of Beris chalybata TaxID=3066262 RepID=UPI00312CBFDF
MLHKGQPLIGPWSPRIVELYNQLIASEAPDFDKLKALVGEAHDVEISRPIIVKLLRNSGQNLDQYLRPAIAERRDDLLQILEEIPQHEEEDEEDEDTVNVYKQECKITYYIQKLLGDIKERLGDIKEEGPAVLKELLGDLKKWLKDSPQEARCIMSPAIVLLGPGIIIKSITYIVQLGCKLYNLYTSESSDPDFLVLENNTCPLQGELYQDFNNHT